MKFAIVVHGTSPTSYAAHSALAFAQAVVRGGHEIYRVFFYHQGVTIAGNSQVLPQDEVNVRDQWVAFSQQHDIELTLCIAAALRRGIIDDQEQARYRRPAATLAEGFALVGLGQLIDAGVEADRLVTFGAP